MHVVLAGATELVGSGVLDAMMLMADEANDPRIHVILHQDFEKYHSELFDKLKGAKGCVWALGIGSTQVTTDFVNKTYSSISKSSETFSLAAARAFQTLASPEQSFTFVYVSGSGANTEPGMFSQLFSRVKEQVEVALADIRNKSNSRGGFHAISTRPMAVHASGHAAIAPYIAQPPLAYRLLIPVLWPVVRTWFKRPKGIHSPTEPLEGPLPSW